MALGALDIIIAADTAQLRKGMDTAVGIMQNSTQRMESFAKTAGASIAGYFALDSLKTSIQASLDLADSLGKMSQKVGVSVDALYSMQAAGKLADVDIQTLEKSLLKFNKGLGQAELGTGDTENALKNLGISLKDSAGHLKTSDEYLYEVADKFATMPDGIAKSKLAMDLFGKSGADMIPLLNAGSEAIKEFNGNMDKTTTDAAERFNDSFTRIGLSVDGAKMKLLISMVPAIDTLSGHIEDLSGWISSNSDGIERFADRAMNDFTALGQVGGDAFDLIGDTSTSMVNAVSDAFEFMAGEVLGSSDDMVQNFGFFEYFILGLSTSINGIGQFVANAKMAYASVAEAHAKYGSISGLLTNGGLDAAQARMDYHAASLEAQKYTKNVVETYNTLAGLKSKLTSDYKPKEKPILPPVDLINCNSPKTGKSSKSSEAEKEERQRKEYEDFAKKQDDDYDKFREERLSKRKKEIEDGYSADIAFIDKRIAAEKKMYDDMLNLSDDWYTSQSIKIGDEYNELEAAGADKVKLQEWLNAKMANLDKEQIEKLKEGTIGYQTVFEDAFKSMEDSMVDMFMTGKFEAEDFFNTIIEGIIRMQIRNTITQPLTTAIGSIDFGTMFSGAMAYDGGMIPEYAVGGYTGDGGKYEPKGVVHGGEYVIPQWMVQKSPDLIGALENTRTRGYVDGGFVGSLVAQSSFQPSVIINIENNSGENMEQSNMKQRFDGKQMIIDVVIDAVTRNKSGMRDIMKGAR